MNKIQLSLLSGILFSSTAFTAPYAVTDLGDLSEGASFANAINNNGIVVGDFEGAVDALTGIRAFGTHAFSFDGTTFVDLSTLNPESTTFNSNSLAINDVDQIVGFSNINTSEDADVFVLGVQAFLYENGVMTSLGFPSIIETNYTSALDINNAGTVVGFTGNRSSLTTTDSAFLTQQAVSIDPTATTDKFTLLGSLVAPELELTVLSAARSINESGQIVGWSETEEAGLKSSIHAFYIDPMGTNVMVDVGTLGGASSSAKQINNSGIMVGRSQLEDLSIGAYRFDIANDSSLVFLGTLDVDNSGSLANAINDNNQIVGASVSGPIPDPTLPIVPLHAVLFENDLVIDLNDQIDCSLGWLLVTARGINDAGQIVGSGVINGNTHGFLLTPTPNGGPAEVCDDLSSSGRSSGGSLGFVWLLLLGLSSLRQRRPLSSDSSS